MNSCTDKKTHLSIEKWGLSFFIDTPLVKVANKKTSIIYLGFTYILISKKSINFILFSSIMADNKTFKAGFNRSSSALNKREVIKDFLLEGFSIPAAINSKDSFPRRIQDQFEFMTQMFISLSFGL